MKLLLLFFSVIVASLSTPLLDIKELTREKLQVKTQPELVEFLQSPSIHASYNFAVDLSVSASVSAFQCLFNNAYQAAFIRGILQTPSPSKITLL